MNLVICLIDKLTNITGFPSSQITLDYFCRSCTSIAFTMAQAVETRNVVVVGKTGAGKSTVANKVLGQEKFTVKNVAGSVTLDVEAHCCYLDDKSSQTRYNLKVIDTVGLFDTKVKNDAAIKKMKNFFQNECPGGVNLVLFVCRKGRFTEEERSTFDYIMKNLRNKYLVFLPLFSRTARDRAMLRTKSFL